MQVVRMRQVQDVVDQQFVVTLRSQIATEGGVGVSALKKAVLRYEIRIRQSHIAGPPPEQAVPLYYGVRLNTGSLRYASLPVGILHAHPCSIEAQAVVRTLQRNPSVAELT